MDPHAGKIVANGAPSQVDRWPRALAAGYARVDGRTYDELLDFSVGYGALINFFDLQDQVDGDWVCFFLSDPTVVLAAIRVQDPAVIDDRMERRSLATEKARRFEPKFELLRSCFAVVLDTARQVDLWLRGLRQNLDSDIARRLDADITAAIEAELGEALQTLAAYDQGAGLPKALGQPIGLDYSGFLPIWGLDSVTPDGSIYRGRNRRRKIDRAVPQLEPLLDPFLVSITDWRTFAAANLPATLEVADHRPQIALYMAFARLFRYAQDTLNTFSSRYIHFYYRDVLRERRLPAIPDQVYLTFTLAEGEEVTSTDVPAGTLFPAGEDAEGVEILFAADQQLTVTAAEIAVLRALRVVRGELLPTLELTSGDPVGSPADGALVALGSPSSPPDPRVAQRILATEISLPEDDGETVPWTTFGRTDVGITEIETTRLAKLGFALASPYLLLAGGQRQVSVRARLDPKSAQSGLEPVLQCLAEATGLPEDEIFASVLDRAFDLYLSTADGWLSVESYRARVERGSPDGPCIGFVLTFDLPPTAPAIVAYDPEDEDGDGEDSSTGTNPDPSLPTLELYLRQEPVWLGDGGSPASPPESPPSSSPPEGAWVYPLSLLAELDVEAFGLDVRVTGLRDVELSNTDGVVDATSPFLVFGGVPTVGSYLSIQARELFVKQLSRLSFGVRWFDLPPNDTGFHGYYRDYVLGLDGEPRCDLFDNRVFRAAIEVEHPTSWIIEPTGSPPGHFLFRTTDDCADAEPLPDAPLCPASVFGDLDLVDREPSPYDDADLGAVRLVLNEPAYAFGSDLYPINVLNAVIEDLPNAEKCQVDCEAAAKPLADAARCIEECLLCLTVCGSGDCGSCDCGSPPDIGSPDIGSPPEEGYVDCCLARCRECLIGVLVRCLTQCIEACLVGQPELRRRARLDLIDERVRLCLELGTGNRAWGLERILDDIRSLLGNDPCGCLETCWQRCSKILDAIQCLEGCAEGCRASTDPYAECVAACLQICLGQLRLDYEKSLEVCMADCLSLKNELKYPNEPWLPQAEWVEVAYSAHCTIPVVADSDTCGSNYLLWPFGGSSRPRPTEDGSVPLLPRFPQDGNLYLGFQGLLPPQILTLLFQMAADRVDDDDLPRVTWGVLGNNCWQTLDPTQIRVDTTDGLESTGIVALALPSYDPSNNTLLSPEYQWLRAAVKTEAGRFPDTAAIAPQVTTATQVIDEESGRLEAPLPAGTITGSVEDLPDIETIDQPMESFGGRPAETRQTFEIRVGERLRHKDRGILSWDYERLVLERFPTTWKVLALPTRDRAGGDVPGSVLLMVVPGPESREAVDPTAPLAPADELRRIRSYLDARISPFVQLDVVNPIYVRIEVKALVSFVENADPGTSIERLDQDLVEYLSPWFYDMARATKGGDYVLEPEISEFVASRPYIAAVDAIDFAYQPAIESLDSDWYFLTSAEKHAIYDADVLPVEESGCY